MNEKKSIGLAVASMVLGIISLLLGCCFWYITLPAALIGVILAAISLSKHQGGKGMAITGLVTSIISLVPAVIIMITGSSLMALGGISDNEPKDSSSGNSIVNELTDETNKTTVPKTTKEKDNPAVSTEPATEPVKNTYEENEYFDIVETASFQNSIGYTIVIDKVLAKKDASIDATKIATASDGSVIGKSTDSITLTEGKYNFFRYSFESDISNATIQSSMNVGGNSIFNGKRNAVEMVQYNQADDNIYITFKQVVDGNIGSFAQFKILFYRDDKIVDSEDGHFSIYAKNLNGKDSTDVAEIWAYGIDFDRIEYIYEP